MKKTLILLMLVMFVISLFAADDLEMILSGAASTDHFTVKDSGATTLFMVKGNGLVNIPTHSSAPSNPSEGDIFTNSTSHEIYYYGGTSWLSLSGVTSESDPTLTDDGSVTIGDGSTNPTKLTFDGSTDADIFYDSGTSTFNFEIGSHNVLQTIHSSGIIDFQRQSRSRAYLESNQNINSGTWTRVDFGIENYDQQNEFSTTSPAHFTATESGYYQVNARTEFEIGDELNNYWVVTESFVEIGIAKGSQSPLSIPNDLYSEGNKLQIGREPSAGNNDHLAESFRNNNAPNVSDVIYLQAGEVIEICVYQNSSLGLPILAGSTKTYVSIHKLS